MLPRRAKLAVPIVTAVLVALVVPACSGGRVPPQPPQTDLVGRIPAEDWAMLASKRILFGHQSVGANILQGVADVMKDVPAIRLNVVEATEPAGAAGVCLVHFRAGRNEDPVGKVDDFVRFVDASTGAPPDIAFLKFCYIDTNARTDVRTLFDHYRGAFGTLRSRHPRTAFVHLTMPLRIVQTGWKVPVKNLIGRPIGGYADNAKRSEFNALLRAEYGGREPVFDLAEIESTRPDGSRVTFESGGRTHEALAEEYTSDGGHLNQTGRRVVAERLLVFLVETARKQGTAAN